jgi:hypothetical protein
VAPEPIRRCQRSSAAQRPSLPATMAVRGLRFARAFSGAQCTGPCRVWPAARPANNRGFRCAAAACRRGAQSGPAPEAHRTSLRRVLGPKSFATRPLRRPCHRTTTVAALQAGIVGLPNVGKVGRASRRAAPATCTPSPLRRAVASGLHMRAVTVPRYLVGLAQPSQRACLWPSRFPAVYPVQRVGRERQGASC